MLLWPTISYTEPCFYFFTHDF